MKGEEGEGGGVTDFIIVIEILFELFERNDSPPLLARGHFKKLSCTPTTGISLLPSSPLAPLLAAPLFS